MQKTAIIIGAGPAGLTAAYELLKKTNIKPIVIEKSVHIGGISKTVNYKGNRIDIGGHRFFSKSDRVMKWWQEIDDNMLIRNRKSRIYFNRTFFDYPVSLSLQTIRGLGLFKTIKIGLSYIKQILLPIKKESNLEDFLINRFGRELYKTFFESYTEKVWGIPCDQISAAWGAQRIKGLSITKALLHIVKNMFTSKKNIEQKNVETTLIAQFLYPKHGPGQIWETVAEKINQMGGQIIMEHTLTSLNVKTDKIISVEIIDNKTHEIKTISGDYVFSSMPIRELVQALDEPIPKEIQAISDGLVYRDFITVGLLLDKLKIKEPDGSQIKDHWIYIQEPDVLVGRLQVFNNWSPYMAADKTKTWVGLEYFCTEGDKLWSMTEKELIDLAKKELAQIDIIDADNVLDATVIKQEKAYPAYFGTYNQFNTLKNYLNSYKNIYFIGRNGMHHYNNQDHSMLSAIKAVENIANNTIDKESVWNINTEKEYHESK
ncbi:NAD(P)/FAD-dependent oxidoreductase [Candidatus Dependentiae bacterium]|nr:NAD(P)/FAD-dependent oxidoreductase [Candidatus Dependentiae bacterium]